MQSAPQLMMIKCPQLGEHGAVELSSYLGGLLHEYACGPPTGRTIDVEPVLVSRRFAWDVGIAIGQLLRDGHAPVECTSKGGSLVIQPQPPYAR
jgi:hypothetical protein